jgi:outer membrane translocation and assembly module TamA
VDAGYSLRAATKLLDSDFVYVKNYGEGRVTLYDDTQRLTIKAGGGAINGTAPLFEQFVAGNTQILRGWNKFDLSPTGGTRLVYGSVEYRYDHFLVFYDTGTVWDRDEAKVLRHGVGVGYGTANWFLAVAFPLRGGGVQPVFMVATNF